MRSFSASMASSSTWRSLRSSPARLLDKNCKQLAQLAAEAADLDLSSTQRPRRLLDRLGPPVDNVKTKNQRKHR